MTEDNTPLSQLPFDQFSRQEWARLIVEQFRTSQQTTFKILDVGGFKGRTSDFQIKDEVFICDLFDIDQKNYIKGDGRKLPFGAKSFDFVVTFDTYEHVPRKDREKFIQELVRVAKHGVILAAPFDNCKGGPVTKAEVLLNDYYKQLYGSDHLWLKEHIDYQIPLVEETEKIFDKLGLRSASLLSNDLDLWTITQYIYFSIELDTELRGRVDDLNRMYSKHFMQLDKVNEFSYRRIYFLGSAQEKIAKIENYIKDQADQNRQNKLEYIAFALSLLGRKYADTVGHTKYLEEKIINEKRSTES